MPRSSRLRWRAFRRSRGAVLGLVLVAVAASLAVMGPLVAPAHPLDLSEDAFAPPSRAHPLGTDNIGRDVLSGVIYGARASLLVGCLAVLTSMLIGITTGAVSGFYGGRIDDGLMRITEIFQVVPRFFLAIVMIALFGPHLGNVIAVIGLLTWPETARLVRAEFLVLGQREFVEAARALGRGNVGLMAHEMLPNALPPVIVSASLQVSGAILLEAGLSFLGLGDPNFISWGFMLHQSQEFFHQAWWMAAFPGGALFATALGLNLVGKGLNDALNPRLRER